MNRNSGSWITTRRSPFRTIFIAGMSGGLAEILWIVFYSSLSGLSSIEVARQVTASIFPAMVNSTWAPVLGVGIHLALSVVLAFAFVRLVWAPLANRRGLITRLAVAVITLVLVWTLNFFIILPGLNASFVILMPYTVTLFSKILFGLAMAWPLLAGYPQQTGKCLSDGPEDKRFTSQFESGF